jgi:hypothetical protein
MGVTGDHDAIRWYGEMFREIPANTPALPPPTLLDAGSPLSAGLASAQNQVAFAAADFARAKDEGTIATGDALVMIAAHLADFDRQGAAGIRRLFPPPANGGGD